MNRKTGSRIRHFSWLATMLSAAMPNLVLAHRETVPKAEAELRMAEVAPSRGHAAAIEAAATLRLQWTDAAPGRPAGGLVRIWPLDGASGQPLPLDGLFERPAGWFSSPAEVVLEIPPGRYRVEATRGTDTIVSSQILECAPGGDTSVTLAPARFHEVDSRGLRSVNTHLHLLLRSRLKMGVDLHSRAEADAYLRTVCASDGLDLVFVSFLTQPGQAVVSNELTPADLAELSRGPTQFADGIEHRHGGRRIVVDPAPDAPGANGAPVYSRDNSSPAMSYGHVLLLDLPRRTVPASIGPGMSDEAGATDGVPLRDGMTAARQAGAAVVWSHGTQGLEWVPSWVAGLLDGQNIYDGGNEGAFEDVYYPLLNAGFAVPFSTGTDWGVWDFSRVHVVVPGTFTAADFRRELAHGRTTITNEPFLEFEVAGSGVGDTVAIPQASDVLVRGRAVGRSDFVRLQLVHDGRVVHEMPCRPVGSHFEAAFEITVPVEDSGWLALRIPPAQPYFIRARNSGPGTNIFGKVIFAHTSPVYVEVAGRARSDPAAIARLIERVQSAWRRIEEVGVFATAGERERIREIYAQAGARLRAREAEGGSKP